MEYSIMQYVKFPTAFFAVYWTYLQPVINGLWYIWKSSYMALIKMGFIVDQYGWNLELIGNFIESITYAIKKFCPVP
jgi:hypothetical protein